MASLSSATLAALSSDQIAALETVDVAALKTSQIAGLTTSSVAALQTMQIVALGTAQIVALGTAQIAALSTEGVAALSTSQIVAITTSNITALQSTQLAALTTTQADALTTLQVMAFTSDQIPALSTDVVSMLNFASPIILDLNGDGVRTLAVSEGVQFDLLADGQKIKTGWVSSSDGLLVLDRNQDGQINDGAELFGTSTILANGQKASDGYAALREFDTNHDGLISNLDADYADLRVWVDANSDAVVDAGELNALSAMDVAKISLNVSAGTQLDNQNILGLISSYETTSGATHAAADVWFKIEKNMLADSGTSVDDAISGLLQPASPILAVEPVPDMVDSAPIVASLFGVQAPIDPTTIVAVVQEDNLLKRVSSLAQAMVSFADVRIDDDLATSRLSTTGVVSTAPATLSSLAVGTMVDVMNQFDANGNQLARPSASVGSASAGLSLPGIKDSVSTGYLAINS